VIPIMFIGRYGGNSLASHSCKQNENENKHVEGIGSNSPVTLFRPFFRPVTLAHKRSKMIQI